MAFGSLNAGQRVTVLLALEGGPRYTANMSAAAGATRNLGRATKYTALEIHHATRRTWLMNQALFTLRRVTFYATLAIGGLIAGMFKLGFSYLSAKQQMEVALRPIIHGTNQMSYAFNRLFEISKYSPFVITDMTNAFRTMYPALHTAGMGIRETINLIEAMTNAMALSGKVGPGQLNRVAYAMQHMLFLGRVTGRVVQQMGSLGVPVAQILHRMGVQGKDFSNISRLNIDPRDFVNQFIKYINTTPGFRNAALRLSLKTFHGTAQVIRDSISQIMGNLMRPLYGRTQGFLFDLARHGGLLDQINRASTRGGVHAVMDLLSNRLTGSTRAAQLLRLIGHDIVGLVHALRILISTLFRSRAVWFLIYAALQLARPLIWILNKLLGQLHWALYILVPLYVSYRWALFYATVQIRAHVFWEAVANSQTRKLTFTQYLARMGIKGLIYGYILLNRAIRAVTSSALIQTALFRGRLLLTMLAVRLAMARAAFIVGILYLRLAIGAIRAGELRNAITLLRYGFAAFFRLLLGEGAVALLTNPVGWIILAVAAVGILYWRWKRFRDSVNSTVTWLYNHSLAAAFTPIFGPLIVAIRLFRHLRDIIHDIYDTFRHPHISLATGGGGGWLGTLRRLSPIPIPRHFPHMAFGGSVSTGGVVTVGERGRENVFLPRGALVTPLARTPHSGLSEKMTAMNDRPIHVQLVVNRKVLAEAVTREKMDRQARR